MNRFNYFIIAGAVIFTPLACASSASVTAQEEPTIQSLTPQQVASGALTPQEYNGVRFVTGGIGIDERAWLAKHDRDFNTHLTFAMVPEGEFVADVHVLLRNKSGNTVLKATANGPKLLAELPVGKYELEATHDGQTIKRAFTVKSKQPVRLDIGFKK